MKGTSRYQFELRSLLKWSGILKGRHNNCVINLQITIDSQNILILTRDTVKLTGTLLLLIFEGHDPQYSVIYKHLTG